MSSQLKGAAPQSAYDAAARLSYIADMLAELERMAETGGHRTLTSLLKVAHREARHELKVQR